MVSDRATYLAVVARGGLRAYLHLCQASKSHPIEVVWDRRTEERRARQDSVGLDRRRRERRRSLPPQWQTLGYVLVRRT